MAVDRNLFLHDLAVVAILKNEGHYLKEWLDYHLLAGVDHFYIYDNDSTDDQAEVAKPYVEAGLVDYFYLPGKMAQYVAYNDAIKRFRFYCRYMVTIDGDEFILPKDNRSIAKVIDEILSQDPNSAGLAIHWQIFGSNGQEKADYSRGVLERFTRRAPKNWFLVKDKFTHGNVFVKIASDPRRVDYIRDAHLVDYFEDFYSVDETLNPIGFNKLKNLQLISAEKIAVNHYNCKSREEFIEKIKRGRAYRTDNELDMTIFEANDRNDEFDDGILKYREAREKNFSLESYEDKLDRVSDTLIKIVSKYAAAENFDLETALTCRAVSTYLREKFPNDADYFRICEKTSLDMILKALKGMSFAEARLLISELPNLLSLPYPAVKDLRNVAIQIISQAMDFMRLNGKWRGFVELDYLQRLLQNV